MSSTATLHPDTTADARADSWACRAARSLRCEAGVAAVAFAAAVAA